MLADIPAEELGDCLDHIAEELLLRTGVLTPPVDALQMAALLGVETLVDRGQQPRARYVELGAARGGRPRPAILLRPEPRSERRQWAVAHELGERESVTVFRRLQVDPRVAPPTAREWVANQLANRILLPTRWLSTAGPACAWDLIALKQQFSTASHELILRRMLEFEPPIVVTIFDNGSVSFRRSNRAIRLAIIPLERACWQAAHRNSRAAECSNNEFLVRGWAVHEEGWKRELLRLELPEMSDL